MASPSSPSPFAVDKTPPSAPSGQAVSVCPDPATGARELGRLVRRAAARAIAERGSFTLVLSGGSLVDALASSLDDVDDGGGGGGGAGCEKEKAAAAAASSSHDGSKWHAFWADERLVPGDSPDSNAGGAKAFLEKVMFFFPGWWCFGVASRRRKFCRRKLTLSVLSLSLSPFPPKRRRQAGIPKENVHALADPPAPCPHEAAKEYEERLRALPREVLPVDKESGGMPVFDLVLLGVGPDGHVASLFPGLPAVDVPAETGSWVVGVEGSPKPPPLRISLTLPAITAAREILIVAFGAGKKEIVGEALLSRAGGESSPPNLLPVQRVKGARWLIDAAAAQGLGVEEKE